MKSNNDIKRLQYISYLPICFILYGIYLNGKILNAPASNCLFHNTFKIPCAGCGGSHAIQNFLHGNFIKAFQYNELVTILFIGCFIFLILDILDKILKKDLVAVVINKTDQWLNPKSYRIFLAAAILSLWIINIFRYRLYF